MQDNIPSTSDTPRRGVSIFKLVLVAILTIFLSNALLSQFNIEGTTAFIIQVIFLTAVVFVGIKKMEPSISSKKMVSTAAVSTLMGLAIPVIAFIAFLLVIVGILFFAAILG